MYLPEHCSTSSTFVPDCHRSRRSRGLPSSRSGSSRRARSRTALYGTGWAFGGASHLRCAVHDLRSSSTSLLGFPTTGIGSAGPRVWDERGGKWGREDAGGGGRPFISERGLTSGPMPCDATRASGRVVDPVPRRTKPASNPLKEDPCPVWEEQGASSAGFAVQGGKSDFTYS